MDYKRVLILHYTNGMSSREIAEATGDGANGSIWRRFAVRTPKLMNGRDSRSQRSFPCFGINGGSHREAAWSWQVVGKMLQWETDVDDGRLLDSHRLR